MSRILNAFILLLLFSQLSIGKPPIFTDTPEDALILSKEIQVDTLLIFSADWCGACDKMKKDLNDDMSVLDDLIVCYIDFDKRPDLVKEFQVKLIPDYMIYSDNKEIKRKRGYKSKEEFKKWLGK